jgi:hypothetical protein
MLRHFVSPRQDDWDEYLATAEFAVNNAKHSSTGYTPFYLVYGRNPRTPADVTPLPRPAQEKRAPAADTFAQQLAAGIEHAKRAIQSAQDRQKHFHDKGIPELSFQVGQQVLLNTKNLTIKGPGPRKLLPRWVGPFTVTKVINPVAYTLALPSTMKIHPSFHVSLLRAYKAGGRTQPPAPSFEFEGDEYFQIDHIVKHTTTRSGKRKYLIRWKGYGEEHNTYEPEENILLSEGGRTLRRYWTYIGQPLPPGLSKQLGDLSSDKDDACEICHSTTDHATMLLCDACDTGWHMGCLDPPLFVMPAGDWLCPRCKPQFVSKRPNTGPVGAAPRTQ